MSTWRLFGLNLASDFPFAHRLGTGEGAPDLIFSWSPEPVEPGADVLRVPQVADFSCAPGHITAHLLDPARLDLVELALLGPVLSYWLERQGIPALHASAVRHGAGAVAFLAANGGGKSSLAAALLETGASLLTDDILPVEESAGTFLARPGYPQMRMEPESARHFLGSTAGLAAVAVGETKLRVPVERFETRARPLSCLYLIERQPPGAPVEILPLRRREAVIELVRHSFSPLRVAAAGLQPRRLDLFARLVHRIPLRRLAFPSGLEHLQRVAGAVLDDLDRL